MKLWVKILLVVIILGILLVAAAAIFGYYTYTKVKNVMGMLQDPSLGQSLANLQDGLKNGNCSELPIFESKVAVIKKSASDICSGTVVKYVISRDWSPKLAEARFACAQLQNSSLDNALSQVKVFCASLAAKK